MIPYAYWDRPRIEVESIGKNMMDTCLVAHCTVDEEVYISRHWFCDSRSGAYDRDCEKLSKQLNSTDFLQKYSDALKRDGRLSRLLDGTNEQLAFRCKPVRYAVIDGKLQDFNGMAVAGVYSKRFASHQPTYQWSRWLQARLPFMPDKALLHKDINELNQEATAILNDQVERTRPDLEWL